MVQRMDSFPWWKTSVFYQIYPRSYNDTTGNGIGDIRGIIEKLDYLKDGTPNSLGIDAIWLSPIFPSPQADFGYDVSNYVDIDPIYGSMDDFVELIAEAHKREIRIILDLVLNHTSDQHPWFLESKESLENPTRDWYIWRSGRGKKGKKPPNNWKAFFGGSAWEWNSQTEHFYYHHFLKEQPDLNYRNPKVREAVINVIRFWLDKGVDGFRLDVIHMLYQDFDLRNNPWSWKALPSDEHSAFNFQNHIYDIHQLETHDFLKVLRQLVDSYNPPRMLLGEVLGPPDLTKTYCGDNDELHLVFNFLFMSRPFKAQQFHWVVDLLEKTLPDPLWPSYVLSNHDRRRAFSRYKCKTNLQRAKLLLTLLLTLRGTPVLYYGEEIGMTNIKVSHRRMQDPLGKRYWLLSAIFSDLNRDGCRSPMQWNPQRNAGFTKTDVRPWLPVSKDLKFKNVQIQEENPNSLLSYYKKLIWLRKKQKALHQGSFTFSESNHKNLLQYYRTYQDEKILVALNFSKKSCLLDLLNKNNQALLKSWIDQKSEETIRIPAYGAVLLQLMN